MSPAGPRDPASGPWHLDKRVPIALIVAIALQTGAGFFWAGAINHRVASIETRQNLADARMLDQNHESRIAVLESQYLLINASLAEIERRLSDVLAVLNRRGQPVR